MLACVSLLTTLLPSLSEFVCVHNGIITNYKDIKAFLVSRDGSA